MGALQDPDLEAAPALRCRSPKLGRFSPILRALFGPQAADQDPDSEHYTSSVATAQEVLDTPFDCELGEFTLESGPKDLGICTSVAAIEEPLSDSNYVTEVDDTPGHPQLLPFSLLSSFDLSKDSPLAATPRSVESERTAVFSPGPDDTPTPATTPSTAGDEDNPTPATPSKIAKKKQPIAPGDSWATTLPSDTVLSRDVAVVLKTANLFVPKRALRFNQITEQNYHAVARRAHTFVVGLFNETMPWFCPVPVLQPLQLMRLKFNDYQPSPKYLFSADTVNPVYLSTREAKLDLIAARLGVEASRDVMLREAYPSVASEKIHVFVDMSNIIIGFYNQLKRSRGIPSNKRVIAPRFFFDGLALILERNRPAAKRVIAGSCPDAHVRENWPGYLKDAEYLGYETNVLNRVAKLHVSPARRVGGRRTGGGNWSSNSSDEDMVSFASSLKQGEQAVDEILHLKMCESVIDYGRSTIVLATGDAASAEFSAGFRAQAERALANGWNVELVTWKSTISSSWQELAASGAWGEGRFRLIPLDWYVEELFDACWP